MHERTLRQNYHVATPCCALIIEVSCVHVHVQSTSTEDFMCHNGLCHESILILFSNVTCISPWQPSEHVQLPIGQQNGVVCIHIVTTDNEFGASKIAVPWTYATKRSRIIFKL